MQEEGDSQGQNKQRQLEGCKYSPMRKHVKSLENLHFNSNIQSSKGFEAGADRPPMIRRAFLPIIPSPIRLTRKNNQDELKDWLVGKSGVSSTEAPTQVAYSNLLPASMVEREITQQNNQQNSFTLGSSSYVRRRQNSETLPVIQQDSSKISYRGDEKKSVRLRSVEPEEKSQQEKADAVAGEQVPQMLTGMRNDIMKDLLKFKRMSNETSLLQSQKSGVQGASKECEKRFPGSIRRFMVSQKCEESATTTTSASDYNSSEVTTTTITKNDSLKSFFNQNCHANQIKIRSMPIMLNRNQRGQQLDSSTKSILKKKSSSAEYPSSSSSPSKNKKSVAFDSKLTEYLLFNRW